MSETYIEMIYSLTVKILPDYTQTILFTTAR